MRLDPTDGQLIHAFLSSTRALTQRGRARALGVSVTTMVRLETGQWVKIHAPTREKLIRYLEARDKMPKPYRAVISEAERRRLLELTGQMRRAMREIEEILAG